MADKTFPPESGHIIKTLSEALTRASRERDLNFAQLARRIGVSSCIIYRIVNCTGLPDMDAIVRICRWLCIPLERVLHKGEAVTYYPQEPLPDIVAQILSCDQTLSAKDAGSLGEIFRTAYRHYVSFSYCQPVETALAAAALTNL